MSAVETPQVEQRSSIKVVDERERRAAMGSQGVAGDDESVLNEAKVRSRSRSIERWSAVLR
jgi:hypothetical protein